MDITEFDRDEILTDFLTDYIEGNLNNAEKASFENYLAENKKEKSFARKAMKGKRALSRLAERMSSEARESTSPLTASDIGWK